ncbi:ribonucleoprotein RB97D isoform X2 [Drosophila elegans]|uniref:ribonucleoprotein RB97D isoform X2 n=1 Tax=Drosophila elegans TaxID=30023 RepID=UPI0007E7B283|nr:ribonucleoprotein RB97D isoform X2 [Drosophila elegans]
MFHNMEVDNTDTASGQRESKVIQSSNLSNPVDTADNPLPSGISGAEGDEHLRKIFIGGLSTQTTVDTLRDFFQKFGEVADAVVMRDPVSNNSRRFGFVTFVEATSVENVQRAMPHTVDNKAVETKRALPRQELYKPGGGGGINHRSGGLGFGGAKSNKIFLGGLKDCHDEKTLCEYFSQFGEIAHVKLLMDKDTGRKRGFGFLEFEETLSAERALEQGKHSIKMNTVEVKKSHQRQDPGKRLRFPVSGSMRTGYLPPQSHIMESYNCNPYMAQAILPPSAFINGWASYVTRVAPSAKPVLHATHPQYHQQSTPVHNFAGYGPDAWSSYQKPGKCATHGWTTTNVGQWPPKEGHKHAQTSTSDRPRSDYMCTQVAPSYPKLDLGARGDADGGSGVGLGLGLTAGASLETGTTKKWPTDDYKIFKPAQSPTPLQNPKIGNGDSPPAYGI